MEGYFDREGSTLGIMDDLQIALHSYDGCGRGCPGCIVDKDFKNRLRFTPIMNEAQMAIVDTRVREYYDWAIEHLNTKESGYFGRNGYKIAHHSYTYRFGNHGELPLESLSMLAGSVQTDYRVFSTGPVGDEELDKFAKIRQMFGGMVFLEIIYDPFVDSPESLKRMILGMRARGLNGYPELLITKKLVEEYPPERFVDECVSVYGDLGTQIQLGRYTPSRTRNFNRSQLVSVDQEVDWLKRFARRVVETGYDIHPIPLGEYAVTLLDEYGEIRHVTEAGEIDEASFEDHGPLRLDVVREKVRDIFITSFYVDHNLDVYVWSESMGQHVLDNNFGYSPLGNLKTESLIDMVTARGGVLDRMLNETIRDLVTDRRCCSCRYKSFCASHAVSLFRRWQKDDGAHCYGYIPVIREFQRKPEFLRNMIDGFRKLNF